MLLKKYNFPCLLLLVFCASAPAQSFLEKQQHGVDLTDVELVNIFLAEVKDCELKVPEFKNQSKPYLEKLMDRPDFKKVAAKKGFDDPELKTESIKFVNHNRKNSNLVNQCKYTLNSLKIEASRGK